MSITMFVQKNKRVNTFMMSPPVFMLMIHPVDGEEDSRQWQEADMVLPLSYSLSFPPWILKLPQRKAR